MSARVDAAVEALQRACTSATPVAPFSKSDASFDVRAGYEVLERLHAWRQGQGWRPVGRKIGFTNFTLWERYGVDRPMWSHVWDRTVFHARDGEVRLSLAGLLEPRIEPEIVFGLAGSLPQGDDPVRMIDAIAWIAPGFEIVHSVFPGWRFGAADCTAAFGLHGTLGVGEPVAIEPGSRRELAERLSTFEMQLLRGDAHVETGRGSNVLGSPLKALMHLRDVLASQPRFPPLAAGEIVTTGTLTDAWPVRAGETWRAQYATLPFAALRATLD